MTEKTSMPMNLARFYMDYYEKNPDDKDRESYLFTAEFNLNIAKSQGDFIEEEYQRLEKLSFDFRTRKLHGVFFN